MEIKINLKDIRSNNQILEFIKESDRSLAMLGYTDHGLRHLDLVALRAREIGKKISLSPRTQELSAIAGFCHDMGNFMGRTQHHYWGALLFHQVFGHQMPTIELVPIVQAIANHDKEEMKFTSPVSAVLVIADKSDVHRSRVRRQSKKDILKDIHDRVNYAATFSAIEVSKAKKQIDLRLKIDTKVVPILEYFEIFTERMSFCRKAAEHLGYKFGLIINNFKLL